MFFFLSIKRQNVLHRGRKHELKPKSGGATSETAGVTQRGRTPPCYQDISAAISGGQRLLAGTARAIPSARCNYAVEFFPLDVRPFINPSWKFKGSTSRGRLLLRRPPAVTFQPALPGARLPRSSKAGSGRRPVAR